jgi:hypothetical protein
MALRWCFLPTVVLLSTLASSAQAKVIFREDFESGTLGKLAGNNNPAGRVLVVMKGAEVVDQGQYAVKVTMQGDERFNAQQLRVQLASINVDVVEGGDTFMSFYIHAKDPPKTRDNFYYYEGNGSGNVMTWWLEPAAGGGTVMKYGTGNLGARGLHWTGNFAIGKWHQLAAHIHWGKTDLTGNIRLWFDGAPVLDKMLQTMVNPGRYYSEPGIHRDMTRTGATEVGVDSIYFDNFITADTLDEIELMTPAPDGSDAGGVISDGGTQADVAATVDAAPAPAGTGGAGGSGGRAGSGGTGTGGSDVLGSGGAVGNASGGVNASGGCTVVPAGSSGPTAAALLGLLALCKRRRARIRQ